MLGADRPDTLTSVANLASLLQDQGRLEEAAAVPACAGGARADAGRRSPGQGLDFILLVLKSRMWVGGF